MAAHRAGKRGPASSAVSIFINYAKWASGFSDAPACYHHKLAYAILGATLARKVFLRVGPITIYPNFYLVLVGRSGMTRKSTSLRMAEDVAEILGVKFYPASFSFESILAQMAGDGHDPTAGQGVFVYDEFRSLLEAGEREYMSGLIPALTTLYSRTKPFERVIGTKEKKTFRISEPCIHIWSATTLAWLEDKITREDVEGGFLTRFLYQLGDTTKEEIRAFPSARPAEELADMADEFSRVINKTRAGEIHYDPAASDIYRKWYMRAYDEVSGGRPMMEAAFQRIADYAHKFAILEAVANGHSKIEISDVKEATGVADDCLRTATEIFEHRMAFSWEEKHMRRIKEIVWANGDGGVSRSAILRQCHLTSKQLEIYLRTLVERGDIVPDMGIGPGGRRVQVFKRPVPGQEGAA